MTMVLPATGAGQLSHCHCHREIPRSDRAYDAERDKTRLHELLLAVLDHMYGWSYLGHGMQPLPGKRNLLLSRAEQTSLLAGEKRGQLWGMGAQESQAR